ncbi:MAG: hypothetical protein KKH98_05495 [Spirochaetes bacterium]|nr:hypothetical protein [Spirochaetota bacterium]
MCGFNNHPNQCNHPATRVFRIIGFTIGGIFLAVVFAFIFGLAVKLLWNWLMPSLFGLKMITYWQAFGIVILAKILFSGFGKHPGHHSPRGIEKKWHKWTESDNEWMPKGSYHNWKYYKEYWHEEGKKSFEAYIDKIQKKEGKEKKTK